MSTIKKDNKPKIVQRFNISPKDEITPVKTVVRKKDINKENQSSPEEIKQATHRATVIEMPTRSSLIEEKRAAYRASIVEQRANRGSVVENTELFKYLQNQYNDDGN